MLPAVVLLMILVGVAPAGAEYREIDVADPATVQGQVFAHGDLPVLPPQPVIKQKEYCGTEVRDERLIAGPKGELKNAIVYFTNIPAGKAAPLAQPVNLDNEKCLFTPHVLSATMGQTLAIHNSDPFLHNGHALLGPRTLFNVAILSGRTIRQPLLDTGLIHINCHVHPWMHAWIMVSDHPYHTVTDSEGRFRIDGLPPGTWTLRVWQEFLGSTEMPIKLMPGDTLTRNLTLEAATEEK